MSEILVDFKILNLLKMQLNFCQYLTVFDGVINQEKKQ